MEKEFFKPEQIGEMVIEDAIRRDCGIQKHLYHGTTKFIARQIQEAKNIKIGDDIGYLGHGFYCYLFDRNASKHWARDKYPNERIAVIGVVANLGNSLFVDYELHKVLKKKRCNFVDDIQRN